jgi:hypothetical protein
MNRHSRTRLLAFAGVLITAAILAFFLLRLDWDEFLGAFHRLQPVWLLASAAAIAGSIALRGLRWQRLGARAVLKPYWVATVLGYVGNALYPARAGEALRIVAICRSTRMTPGQAIASAFADRLCDVFVLGAVALAALVLAGLGPQGERVVAAVVLLSALPTVVFVGFLRWGAGWSRWIVACGKRFPKTIGTLSQWFAEAVHHTSMLRNPRTLISVVSLSLVAAMADYLSIWLAMQAMGWSLPLVSAVLLGVLLAMGSLIPAAPGYIGVYQVASVLALTRYGTNEAAALAFSVVVQGIALATIIVHGFVVLAHYGWRMKDLRLERDAADFVEATERRDM